MFSGNNISDCQASGYKAVIIFQGRLAQNGIADEADEAVKLAFEIWDHYMWLYQSGEYDTEDEVTGMLQKYTSAYVRTIIMKARLIDRDKFLGITLPLFREMDIYPDFLLFPLLLLDFVEFIKKIELVVETEFQETLKSTAADIKKTGVSLRCAGRREAVPRRTKYRFSTITA